ncbi:ATP-dependent DNA helicase RecQ [Erythrobacter longus]|uniref:DNA helicase RecQ n=1 Tax=Erythrobacter longus TaxID=1044 RepID=A0A074M278_ERYLO|nr:ATP-dependent DNA helicase RecQ [Erythrobacter longus]
MTPPSASSIPGNANASLPEAAYATLRRTFGFDGFRGMQERVIARILGGEHTLALMPTGAGKSLCYQIPALVRDGTAIVISPLIALMHDQIRAARAVGIRAASLTSVDVDQAETVQALRSGELDLLYVAPERANTSGFQALLSQAQIGLFAIDEAHCVSEWGHDFRPDYRGLRDMLDRFGDVPRLALTATADEVTREDILKQLGIEPAGLIKAGFDRPNIRYAIAPRANQAKQIADVITRTPGAGIVYANSRKGTEDLAAKLASTGRQVRAYHAGLPPEQRAATQAEFVASEDMVMVATIAFGMGIDKPDVRFVIHAGLPKSIEAYYQETGRAGRDGDPAAAHMFWAPSDFAKARQWLSDVDEARMPSERARLNALAGLVESAGCRRKLLLKHFGDDLPEPCGNCDRCLNPPKVRDVTELAQKLLSAVYRTGQSFGMGHIERVLLGRDDPRVIERRHDKLSVFGIVGTSEAPLLKPVMRFLTAHEMLATTEHGGLALGPEARDVLKGERAVMIAEPPKAKGGRGEKSSGAIPNPVGDPLFDALRARRSELAKEHGVPAYIIFHDSVLRAMAAFVPQTLREIGELQGVGEKKLDTWGHEFLTVLREFGAR